MQGYRGPVVTPSPNRNSYQKFRDKGKGAVGKMTQVFTTAVSDVVVHHFQMLHEGGTTISKFQRIVTSKALGFMTTKRTVENFIDTDGQYLARNCGQLFFRCETQKNTKVALLLYMARSSMRQVIPVTMQYALCVGCWATIVAILEELSAENNVPGIIDSLLDSIQMLISNWRFLPTLLIVFKVNSHINRWVQWLGNAGGVCGKLGDLALIIGALDDINSPDREVRDRTRRLQFRFYRYLNIVHVLTYFGLDHRIGQDPEDLVEELSDLGLIEEEEKKPMLKTKDAGMHATVLTWLAIVWHSQIEFHQAEGDNHPNSTNFMQKLMDLRGQIGCVRCELDYSDPEVTRGMMYMVTYLLLFFVLIGLPLQFYVKGQCFQWQAILVSISEIVMYHGLLVMQDILARSPFDVMGECVNMDYLLCGGEEMIFHMIRAGYDPLEGKTSRTSDRLRYDRQMSSLYAHPQPREPSGDIDLGKEKSLNSDIDVDINGIEANSTEAPHSLNQPAPPREAPPTLSVDRLLDNVDAKSDSKCSGFSDSILPMSPCAANPPVTFPNAIS